MIRASLVAAAVAAAALAFAIPAAGNIPASSRSGDTCLVTGEQSPAVPDVSPVPQLPDPPESQDLASCLNQAEIDYDSAVADAADVNRYGVEECNRRIDGSKEPAKLRECLTDVRHIYEDSLATAQRELDQRTEDCYNAYQP